MEAHEIESLIRSCREVFTYIFLGICAAYAYAVFLFRPQNPFGYPGVEEKLYTVLCMAAIAAAVFYLPLAIVLLSKAIKKIRFNLSQIRINTKPITRKISAELSKLHVPNVIRYTKPITRKVSAELSKLHVPNVIRYTKPVARALSFVWLLIGRVFSALFSACCTIVTKVISFLNWTYKWLCRSLDEAKRYAKINFYPGRRWFFATVGFEIFLVVLPLVLTSQKSLVEISALLFLAYAVFSYMNRMDDRIMIVTALLFLGLCPVLLAFKEDAKAELSAIYAYYALCTGVLLQFADFVKNRDKYDSD